MKDSFQIILVVVAFSFAGFRIYQKYIKKSDPKSAYQKKPSPFTSSSKDDEYEPYSKK
jgi:hypothetical protein